MARTKQYFMFFGFWKIITDYIRWVEAGGEDIYGCLEIARKWANSLLCAQNECFV